MSDQYDLVVEAGMQAVVLAGGRGVRLRPLTDRIQKSMISVAGRPFLWHQLRLLEASGIKDVVLLIGYRGEQIKRYFGSGSELGLRITYSVEAVPLGTGGCLRLAKPLLDDAFFVLYGDSYLPENYPKLALAFKEARSLGLVVVYGNQEDTRVPNNMALDSRGYVTRYDKGGQGDDLVYVDAGVSLLKRRVVDFIEAGQVASLEEEVFPKLIAMRELRGYVTSQRFYDIGMPERLKELRQVLR